MSQNKDNNDNLLYTCVICHKKYIREKNFLKHKIFCEMLNKQLPQLPQHITNIFTQHTNTSTNYENTLPTYPQLVNAVKELTKNYILLKNKIDVIEINMQKNNTNFNNYQLTKLYNLQPYTDFYKWIEELDIHSKHFELLLHNNISFVIENIIQFNTSKNILYPIYYISQHIYIYI